MIPEDIQLLVLGQTWNATRNDPTEVLRALGVLGVDADSELGRFFAHFRASVLLGTPTKEELMDPCVPSEQIAAATEFAKETFELEGGFLALTSGEGGGFFLYEIGTGEVYDLGVEEFDALKSGGAEARWSSFFEFIRWYLTPIE